MVVSVEGMAPVVFVPDVPPVEVPVPDVPDVVLPVPVDDESVELPLLR